MSRDRSAAVVVGASMAGLLAVRALSEHFARVTLVERDVLPPGADGRKGVPQGSHAHGLLASGCRVLDGYFGGMMDELAAAGAPRGDVTGDFLWYQYGGWKLRHDSGLRGMTVSRPALEGAVRRRVRALPNVAVLDGCDVERPLFDAELGRVTGVAVRRRGSQHEETLVADLVVDATGRGSRSPRWLDEWGFGRPPVRSIRVDVGYATRILERRRGDFRGSIGGIVASTPPESTRYAAVLAAEGGRWVVTLAGMLGDYPPTDEAGWLGWARTLPVPDVYALARGNRSVGGIASYRFPANERRYYERMKRFPDGYLVLGDAICSFNPIYGQGMSVAAMESKALGDCLAAGRDRLAQRFFRASAEIVEIPWLIATGEDLRYPRVAGERPRLHGVVSRYFERLHHVATFDPVVCRRFFEVANLLAPPPVLMAPAIARRVLLARRPQAQPAVAAPAAVPEAA
jgi:2-polyprenyl-6-methoxyphenol hydroxylase-like FAD-dependent oxidoreductase